MWSPLCGQTTRAMARIPTGCSNTRSCRQYALSGTVTFSLGCICLSKVRGDMQVVLKPDPGNPQELYLGSLQALGIDTRAHDVRFVEDNWENPALGAWGLGWEVWMDGEHGSLCTRDMRNLLILKQDAGQEITQFTYFQQAGGHALAVPSIEITYGLERITTFLQVANFTPTVAISQID